MKKLATTIATLTAIIIWTQTRKPHPNKTPNNNPWKDTGNNFRPTGYKH